MIAFIAATLIAATVAQLDVSDGLTLAKEIAATYAAQVRGVLSFVVTTNFDARGGPFKKVGFSYTAFVEADGTPVRKRVIRDIADGKVADTTSLTALSAQSEEPLTHFGMRLPYVASAVGDYRYAQPVAHAGTVDVAFTTTLKDQFHGNGTMTYDRTDGRLAQVTFQPAVLPAHATSIVVTVSFGRSIDERWDIVKIARVFTGREGIISGHGSSTSIYERYRIHANETAAGAVIDDLTAP